MSILYEEIKYRYFRLSNTIQLDTNNIINIIKLHETHEDIKNIKNTIINNLSYFNGLIQSEIDKKVYMEKYKIIKNIDNIYCVEYKRIYYDELTFPNLNKYDYETKEIIKIFEDYRLINDTYIETDILNDKYIILLNK